MAIFYFWSISIDMIYVTYEKGCESKTKRVWREEQKI